jgi:hypothetical protein
MLKIGTVKWRGKCSKHPGYDPAYGGQGAIKGNCEKCLKLFEIYEHYLSILRLMRNFQPAQEKPKTAQEPLPPFNDLQQSLFS